MAFVLRDRVGEQIATEGTGALVLSGVPMSGYQSIRDVMATGDTSSFCVRDRTAVWNVFIGTWDETTGTLTRSVILDGSSGADVPVSLTGAAEVWMTQAAILSQIAASTATIVPTSARVWSGGVTDTSLQVAFDVSASIPSMIQTVGLAVSTTSNMSAIVATAADVSPTVTAGRSATYRSGFFTITGLSADTVYYYAPKVNGAIQTQHIGRVRTAPTQGVAKSFNFIWASCTNSAYTLPNVFATIAPKAPAFIVHGGDLTYLNPEIADIGLMRDGLSRRFRSASGVQSMLLSAPIVVLRDDHETWANNGAWGMRSSAGYTFEEIAPLSIQEYGETTPSYPVWDSRIIGQSWTWGRCRFIAPDLRHQATNIHTIPTCLGDGTSPPDSYDQVTKVLAEIDQAASDGMKVLFFVVSRTWYPDVGDGWGAFAPEEQSAIADKLGDCNVQAYLLVGDRHQMAVDDGTYSDRSSTLTKKIPHLLSSGWFMQNLQNLVTQASWAGADGLITTEGTENATAYMNIVVTDTGGSDVHVSAEAWGGPIDGTSATLLTGRTYDSDDDVCEVGFSTSDTLYIPDGEDGTIEVEKTWFGACSATGTYTSGRTPPSVVFPPNSNRILLPYNYIAGASDTLTLSAPVGCVLGANTARVIDYYTLETETEAYLDEMDVRPTTSQIYAINTLIAGLIADGVWTDLVKVWWLGAPTQQASLLNMVAPTDALPTLVNNPVYAPLRGWKGNNLSGDLAGVAYLDTGYQVPGGMQNDFSAFVWTLDATQGPGDMGAGTIYISSSHTVDTTIRYRAVATTTDSVASPTGLAIAGMIGFARNASTGYVPYVNGAAQTTVTRTSAAPSAANIWLCGYNTTTSSTFQSSPRTNAFGIIANGLSGTQVGNLYARLNTFLQAMGTV